MRLMSLNQLIDHYQAALDRLQSWGVRIQGTRLSAYLKLLKQANAREQAGNETHQEDEAFRSAIIEAADIIDIARLDESLLTEKHTLDKLKEVSSGKEQVQDDAPDHARDYAFEFACAGDLYANDLFAGFSGTTGDVLIAPGGWPAECKRVNSLRRLPQRVREARKQLQSGFESGSPPGLIALDLSRPIRREQGHLAVKSDEALLEATDTALTAYMAQFVMRALAPEDIAHPGMLGIMVRYVSVGTAGEASKVRRTTSWQLMEVHAPESNENAILRQAAVLGGNVSIVDGTGAELWAAMQTAFPDHEAI